MSIKLMTSVFESDFEPSEKLLLLAMADFANDDGKSVYPSQATLSKKTSLTDRHIRTLLKKLKSEKVIKVVGHHGSGTCNYELNAEAISIRKPVPTGSQFLPPRKPVPVDAEATSYDPSLTIIESPVVEKPPQPKTTAQHPVIQTIREITKRYPPTGMYDTLIKTIGDNPNAEKLKACYVAWCGRGYSSTALVWALEWYKNGIPTRGGQTAQTKDPNFRRRPKPEILP